MTDSDQLAAFFKVHANLPRQGPGSDLMTEKMISLLPPLPTSAHIVDAGCGPGRATLILAGRFDALIVAVDLHEAFLRQLSDKATQASLAHRIQCRVGDLAQLEERELSVDLIWSEGAIYNVGFDNGLRCWHPLLKKGAVVACSELSFLTDSPAGEVVAFWARNYPGMRSEKDNVRAALELGYDCLHAVVLPVDCWWEYYTPMRTNIENLRLQAQQDPLLAKAIAHSEEEINLFEKHSSEYGYVFYILQKPDLSSAHGGVDRSRRDYGLKA